MCSYLLESFLWAFIWVLVGYSIGYYQGRKGNNGTRSS